jgi:hypothetical protein
LERLSSLGNPDYSCIFGVIRTLGERLQGQGIWERNEKFVVKGQIGKVGFNVYVGYLGIKYKDRLDFTTLGSIEGLVYL